MARCIAGRDRVPASRKVARPRTVTPQPDAGRRAGQTAVMGETLN